METVAGRSLHCRFWDGTVCYYRNFSHAAPNLATCSRIMGLQLPGPTDIGRVIRLLYTVTGIALVVVVGFMELPGVCQW